MSYIIRVDDRLLHGQVIEGWIKPLKINFIVICSDVVYCDNLQKCLYSVSVPEYIIFECLSVDLTAQKLVSDEISRTNSLVLISSLSDLKELVIAVNKIIPGYSFPNINIGGIRHKEGRVQINKALFLNMEDVNTLKDLDKMGLRLEYYVLPEEQRILLNTKIEEIERIVVSKNE